jgi:hypothetical protein
MVMAALMIVAALATESCEMTYIMTLPLALGAFQKSFRTLTEDNVRWMRTTVA